jgi:hypothetical protein
MLGGIGGGVATSYSAISTGVAMFFWTVRVGEYGIGL